jgi:hypothetical protein
MGVKPMTDYQIFDLIIKIASLFVAILILNNQNKNSRHPR